MKSSRYGKGGALVLAVLACGAVEAGRLDPPGGPGPTDRKPIYQVDMPFTISAPGSYVVRENLTGIAGQNGIVIDANNVVLDLNGFTVQGVTGSLDGIFVTSSASRQNVSITNGTVAAWSGDGIDTSGGTASIIRNVLAGGNNGVGIRVGAQSLVDGSITSGNGSDGILTLHHVIVRDSIAKQNGGSGIRAEDNFLTVSDCVSDDNAGHGISMFTGTITGSTSTNNTRDGIVGAGLVRGCMVSVNDGVGIVAGGGLVAEDNWVHQNEMLTGGLGRGILVMGDGNRISRNRIEEEKIGVSVVNATNVITGNVLQQISGTPIQFPAGTLVGTVVTTEPVMNGSANELINLVLP